MAALAWLGGGEVAPAKVEEKKGLNKKDLNRMGSVRPVKPEASPTTSERGLRQGWTRATVIVQKEHLERLKDLAYWERVTIKYLLNQALEDFLRGRKVRRRKMQP